MGDRDKAPNPETYTFPQSPPEWDKVDLGQVEIGLTEVSAEIQGFVLSFDQSGYPVLIPQYADIFKKLGHMTFQCYVAQMQNTTKENQKEVQEKFGQIRGQHANLEPFLASIRCLPESVCVDISSDETLAPYLPWIEAQRNLARYALPVDTEKVYKTKIAELRKKIYDKYQASIIDAIPGGETRTLSALQIAASSTDPAVHHKALNGIRQIYDDPHKVGDMLKLMQEIVMLDNEELRLRGLGTDTPETKREWLDELPQGFMQNLNNQVKDLYPISQAYYRLKAQMHNADQIHYAQRDSTIPNPEGKQETYSFRQACEIVDAALLKFDPVFSSLFRQFLKENRLDSNPRPKRMNGNSAHSDYEGNVVARTNFGGTPRDVIQLGHEVGHMIHMYLAGIEQNALSSGIPSIYKEFASTLCENIVFEHLLTSLNGQAKINLQMQRIGEEIQNMIRQVAFFDFEKQMHIMGMSDEGLDSTKLGEMFRQKMKAYMGDAVDCNGIDNWWLAVVHFFNPNWQFTTYQYSTGVIMANNVLGKIRDGQLNFQAVLEFMKAGSSRTPEDLAHILELDLSSPNIWRDGLDRLAMELAEVQSQFNSTSKQ